MQRQQLIREGQKALESGRFGDAAALFSRLAETSPGDHRIQCFLSAARFGEGQFSAALQAARQARKLAPQAIEPWYVLAPAALCAGDERACAEAFSFVSQMDRRTGAGIASFWAQRLVEHEKFGEAAIAYGAFAEAHPGDYDTDVSYAEHLLNAFQPQQAERVLFRAINADKTRAEAFTLRARAHLQSGALNAAKDDTLKAIALDQQMIPAYVVLSEIDATALDDQMRANLASHLHDPAGAADRRSLAGFALGRALEKCGESEAAFAAFAQANTLAKSAVGCSYDPDANETAIRDEIRRFPPDALKRPAPDTRRGEGLIFITGMPRSGSTLIDQILASHSQVSSAGESAALPGVYRAILARTGGADASTIETIDRHAEEWETAYRRALMPGESSAGVIVDKMLQNFWRLGLIARLFPAARIILMQRDPMDVGLSIFRVNFVGGHTFSYDLADIAHYLKCFEAMTGYWRRVLGDRLKIISYEDFISDFDANVPALLADCGLAMEPACLAFEQTARPIFTASAAQVRRGLSRESHGRWRRYETQLAPLRRALDNIRIEF